MSDDMEQEQVKQMIKDCLDDKDVMIIGVDWSALDAESDICEMKVTFDLKTERTAQAIQDAFEHAMGVVGKYSGKLS